MTEAPAIGFIGLGNMGGPMARRLAGAGFDLVAYDLDANAVAALCREVSARGAASPAEVGERCSTIILMLPNGTIVRELLLGSGALAERCRRGSLIVDMSSSAPIGTRALGRGLAERGLKLLDAPVSGGVSRAAQGTLSIMVGGDEALAARAEPVFAPLGRPVRVGPLGAGHAVKAWNNYLSAVATLASCEAIEVCRSFGVAPEVALDVINASTGCNYATLNKIAQHVLPATYASGFSLSLMRKDLDTAIELGRELDVQLPLAERVRELWAQADDSLGAGADHTEIHRLVIDGAPV